jgi:vacuolar protein sorting-associated protein 13A/C
MTTEELAEREHEAKMRKLENAELMMQHIEDDAIENAKNDTFANQLITRILNNLQFSIKNIHIRYEDNVSTQHRFAAGITLNELSAITTDEYWTPNTIGEAVNTIFKVIDILYINSVSDMVMHSLQHWNRSLFIGIQTLIL